MKIPRTFEQWFRSVAAAFIGGAATAGFSTLGIATAKGMGVEMPTLNWKAIGVIMLVGGITNLCAFLMKSPVPAESVTESSLRITETNPEKTTTVETKTTETVQPKDETKTP